jgi:hypothetical protein
MWGPFFPDGFFAPPYWADSGGGGGGPGNRGMQFTRHTSWIVSILLTLLTKG